MENLELDISMTSLPVKLNNNGTVTEAAIRKLDGHGYEQFVTLWSNQNGKESTPSETIGKMRKVVLMGLIKQDSSTFTEDEILAWPGIIVQKLAEAVADFNGLRDAPEKKDEAAKNS